MCNELLKHLETCQIANPPQLNGSEYTCLQIEQSRFGFYPARFDLARNRVGDRGALSLAAALPRCHLHAGFSEARKQLKPQKANDTMNYEQQTSTDFNRPFYTGCFTWLFTGASERIDRETLVPRLRPLDSAAMKWARSWEAVASARALGIGSELLGMDWKRSLSDGWPLR